MVDTVRQIFCVPRSNVVLMQTDYGLVSVDPSLKLNSSERFKNRRVYDVKEQTVLAVHNEGGHVLVQAADSKDGKLGPVKTYRLDLTGTSFLSQASGVDSPFTVKIDDIEREVEDGMPSIVDDEVELSYTGKAGKTGEGKFKVEVQLPDANIKNGHFWSIETSNKNIKVQNRFTYKSDALKDIAYVHYAAGNGWSAYIKENKDTKSFELHTTVDGKATVKTLNKVAENKAPPYIAGRTFNGSIVVV